MGGDLHILHRFVILLKLCFTPPQLLFFYLKRLNYQLCNISPPCVLPWEFIFHSATMFVPFILFSEAPNLCPHPSNRRRDVRYQKRDLLPEYEYELSSHSQFMKHRRSVSASCVYSISFWPDLVDETLLIHWVDSNEGKNYINTSLFM